MEVYLNYSNSYNYLKTSSLSLFFLNPPLTESLFHFLQVEDPSSIMVGLNMEESKYLLQHILELVISKVSIYKYTLTHRCT